ncbi:hypothetical protein BKK54_11255 [Rodentibacter genomosp. 1]|uniref:Uncharacterized protein n=1 Tax=Rodentibacter genomosp. 1 TaxID=1908264 RepID=A0A1V3IZR4_9PAST|nr:hypothetical protein BKK54_11255 [Rodentibacter genomosp. 1]
MRVSKVLRIIIASILSFYFIYFTLIIREVIDPGLNHFFYNLIIWGGFLCFSAILISYYSSEIYGKDKKISGKNLKHLRGKGYNLKKGSYKGYRNKYK